ncbi:hypothetical protein LTT66_30470 [Nocardia gipuzkoensis]|uniref:hypothetical protein n=1 Tax=Nocardia gipuzkoensis TaxID=2749991 RepID=UPI001E607E55|nr:hypothetical protein [Nocardia gipuzkoensis]UGT67496.1 hypothetical protein LTT66_30470 [Nocardia gipuzkoensis]
MRCLDCDGWVAAVAGCAEVLHVASPFPSTPPDDENELIDTAVEGTLRVLRVCAAAGTVRRVVLTSSIAAIAYGHADDALRTEADWGQSLGERCWNGLTDPGQAHILGTSSDGRCQRKPASIPHAEAEKLPAAAAVSDGAPSRRIEILTLAICFTHPP